MNISNTSKFFPLMTLAVAATLAGCTIARTPAPSLTGPSELGLSLAVAASRDVIPRDGASQATISILARDPNAQPVRNVTLRIDVVDPTTTNIVTNMGTLSATTITTDSGGQASVIFTAPVDLLPGVDQPTPVVIRVMPIGTDFSSTLPRFLTIRLVPTTIIFPPGSPTPVFTCLPTTTTVNTVVNCDASKSFDSDGFIVSYTWDWGDGVILTRTFSTEQHDWAATGTYFVKMTVTDNSGKQSFAFQQIDVK